MSPPPPPTPVAARNTDTFGSNQMMGIINTARSSSSRTVDVFPGGPIQEMNCSPSQTHCLCSEPREMCGWAVSWGPEAMRAPGCWRYSGTSMLTYPHPDPQPRPHVCRLALHSANSVPPLHHTYIHRSSITNCRVSAVLISQIGLIFYIVSVCCAYIL